MANPIKTIFKDAIGKVPSGQSNLSVDGKGPTAPAGDLKVNGSNVVIGAGLHDSIKNIK